MFFQIVIETIYYCHLRSSLKRAKSLTFVYSLNVTADYHARLSNEIELFENMKKMQYIRLDWLPVGVRVLKNVLTNFSLQSMVWTDFGIARLYLKQLRNGHLKKITHLLCLAHPFSSFLSSLWFHEDFVCDKMLILKYSIFVYQVEIWKFRV
jgi:hypothetical protein